MKRSFILSVLALFLGFLMVFSAPMDAFAAGSGCGKSKRFFGLKPWYYELDTTEVKGANGENVCEIAKSNFKEENLAGTVWKIILTILSDLFYVVGLAAVVMIIVSGLRYILSAGNVTAAMAARKALVGSLVGVVIALLATVIVNVILGLF